MHPTGGLSNTTQRKRRSRATKPSRNTKRARHADTDEWNKRTKCSIMRLGSASAAACLPLILPEDMSTAALDTDTSLLAASLYPLPVDEFKREHWRRRAVAILGAGSARVQRLITEELCELDVREMMAASASEQIFVWMKEQPAATATSSSTPSALAEQPITSFPLDNPSQLDAALACYNSGSSLYFRSPPALAHRFVRAFNAAVGFNFAGLDYSSTSSSSQPKGEIEVFVSRAGHHTGWHKDFQDNFTIQLRGRKTWTFGVVDVQHPIRGFTPHYKDRSTDELQHKVYSACTDQVYTGKVPVGGEQVTLSAGDVLYHPAGIWHAVSCDEDSVSINISLIATTAADLISDAVRQLLWRAESGRAGLCGTLDDMRKQLGLAFNNLEYALTDGKFNSHEILPATMMAPRSRRPHYIDAAVDERMLVRDGRPCKLGDVFSVQTYYRFNTLMTITPHRGGQDEQDEEDEDEEKDKDAEEGGEEPDEVKEGERRGHTQLSQPNEANEEQKEREGRQEQSEVSGHDDESEYAQYVLHHLFGNESVDSAVRILIRVHRSLQSVFDLLISMRYKEGGPPVWLCLNCLRDGGYEGEKHESVYDADDVLNMARCLFVLSELEVVTEHK